MVFFVNVVTKDVLLVVPGADYFVLDPRLFNIGPGGVVREGIFPATP